MGVSGKAEHPFGTMHSIIYISLFMHKHWHNSVHLCYINIINFKANREEKKLHYKITLFELIYT